MEIRRVTSQGPETLDDFYRDLLAKCKDASERRMPQCMLDLLAELRKGGPKPVVWGLTSMYRLGLRADDDWKSRSRAFIEPTIGGAWNIHCALPPERCPWPEAVVSGYTEDLSEAVRRVRLGLEWAGLLASDENDRKF